MSNKTPKTKSLERQKPVTSSPEHFDGHERLDIEPTLQREEIRDIIREELRPLIAQIQDILALCKKNEKSLGCLLTEGNMKKLVDGGTSENANNIAATAHADYRSVQEDTYAPTSVLSTEQSIQEMGYQAPGILTREHNVCSDTNPKDLYSENRNINEKLTEKSFSISEPRQKKPHPSPRAHSVTHDRVNANPVFARQLTMTEQRRRPAHNKPPANERDCLANALQSNIEAIVDDLIFDESELPDQLVTESCVTENECSVIRTRNKQDQVRLLINVIKARDLCVLKKFVKIVQRSNQTIADKIKTAFEENKKSNPLQGAKCPCCEMKSKVDIKYAADGLWGIGAISDGLYREIVESEKHAGSQGGLWIKMLESINNIVKKEDRSKAFEGLVGVLKRKKYSYIAEKVEKYLQKDRYLSCTCAVVMFQMNRMSLATTTGSSCSPQSSVSDDLRSSFRSDADDI